MGKGGAQKPESKPRQVQELGRVCLGRKLLFCFCIFLISFQFSNQGSDSFAPLYF